MKRKDIEAWLKTLPKDASVGIDADGMRLCVEGEEDPYLEIGGMNDGR